MDLGPGPLTITGPQRTGAPHNPYSLLYRQMILGAGPIRYWRLDEASGNLIDQVSGAVMTPAGTPTYSQAGALFNDPDTAAAFNGVDAYFDDGAVLPPLLIKRFSCECWFKRTSAGLQYLFGTQDPFTPTSGQFQIQVRNTAAQVLLSVVLTVGQPSVSTTVTVTDGVWHHVVATYDGTNINLYVDGIAGVPTVTTGTNLSHTIDLPFRIGVTPGAVPQRFWNGSVDEVAIYVFALTAAQVLSHYNLGKTGAFA